MSKIVNAVDAAAMELAAAEQKLQDFLFKALKKEDWLKFQELKRSISNKEKAFTVAKDKLTFNAPVTLKCEYVTISSSQDYKLDRQGLIDAAVNGDSSIGEYVQPYMKVVVRKVAQK